MRKRDQELKPCPFCGHLPRIRYTFGKPVIECEKAECGRRPSTWVHSNTNDFNRLVKIWNIRGYHEEDDDECSHGEDWDDCPDCRH